MTFDPPFSINQVAAALNISRTAVYEILARGEMTAVKLNGKTLVRSTEVERYFESLCALICTPRTEAHSS
jgi:excisionase family DNA binding protein